MWFCHDGQCGGLADRLSGLTYTLLLAVMSQRVLLFDWRDSRISQNTYLEPNAIDWRLTEEENDKAFRWDNRVKADQSAGKDSVTYVPISVAWASRQANQKKN